MESLRVLLEAGQLRAGLLAGGLALVVVGLVRLVGPSGERRGPAGVAFVAAAACALSGAFGASGVDAPPGAVLCGLALLAAGGAAGSAFRGRRERPLWVVVTVTALALVPGAVLVGTRGGLTGPGWVVPLVVGATAVGGALVSFFDADPLRRGLGPPMWAVTVLAVFATVPDTEEMRALVGVAVPLALLGGVRGGGGLGPGGSAAAVGLLLHTAAVGGVGRPSSLVGAVGALGLLAVMPLAGERGGRRHSPAMHAPTMHAPGGVAQGRHTPAMRSAAVLVAAHTALALYAARVAGFERDPVVAGLLLLPALVAAVMVAVSDTARAYRSGEPLTRAVRPPRAQPRRARGPGPPPRSRDRPPRA